MKYITYPSIDGRKQFEFIGATKGEITLCNASTVLSVDTEGNVIEAFIYGMPAKCVLIADEKTKRELKKALDYKPSKFRRFIDGLLR